MKAAELMLPNQIETQPNHKCFRDFEGSALFEGLGAGSEGETFASSVLRCLRMTDQTVVKFKKPSRAERHGDRIPCLIVIEGNYIGEIHRLDKTSVTIGRSDQADLYLSEEGVSRQHARIDQHEQAYTLSDLESTNGTYVNGDPIEQVILRDGDKIRLGEVVLRFAYQDSMDVSYQQNLRNMAMRDGLTKIYNRRYFLEALNREISYALRLRQPLACILLDIDRFKGINDSFGHQGGDAVLRTLSASMAAEVRGYDVVARYGGEEFAILLRGTPLDNALVFAERVRKMIEGLHIEFEEQRIPVTVSLGVSCLNPDQVSGAEDLIKEADHYLYEAKRQGRNRVCSCRV